MIINNRFSQVKCSFSYITYESIRFIFVINVQQLLIAYSLQTTYSLYKDKRGHREISRLPVTPR